MKLLRSVSVLFALVAVTASSSAQDFTFFGQIRERTELDARNPITTLRMDVPHYLRTRFGAGFRLNDQINARIEFQDARLFGENKTTANVGSPNFDMRQGYIEVSKMFGSPLTARVGRTTLSYANQRFLGLNDWGNTGQSFDGASLRIGSGELTADVLAYALARNVNLAGYYDRDVFLTGTWVTWKPENTKSTMHVFYLYDNPKNSIMRMYRHTAGVNANGAYGAFDFDIDAALQFGDHILDGAMTAPHSISANMVGVRAGYTFPELADLRVGVGFDRFSGSDPAKTDHYGAFNTLYGTKHTYLGFMDYFRDIPTDTRNLGLQDIIVQASLVPDTDVKVAVDFHLFSTVIDPLEVASIKAVQPEATNSIGIEFDLTVMWKMFEKLNMSAGYSTFNRSADSPLLQGRKTTTWGYVMMTLNI